MQLSAFCSEGKILTADDTLKKNLDYPLMSLEAQTSSVTEEVMEIRQH